MIINHNLNVMNAHRNMSNSVKSQGKSMEKLSSGLRIGRAGDDAAGLAISEKMRTQIRGLDQASRNAQDGIPMVQTAEGALTETHAITQRMRELAVQSANGTYTDEDREIINQEFTQLKKEIDRIADDTDFGGVKVLSGSISSKNIQPGDVKRDNGKCTMNFYATGFKLTKQDAKDLGEGNFTFKVSVSDDSKVTIDLIDKSYFNDYKEYIIDSYTFDGTDPSSTLGSRDMIKIKIDKAEINMGLTGLKPGGVAYFDLVNASPPRGDGVILQVEANQNQRVGFSIENMSHRELGLGGINISTAENAQEAIARLDFSINAVSTQRADLGAIQNRLETIVTSTNNTAENLQAAESRIRDVDMAKEMMNLTKLNILQQVS